MLTINWLTYDVRLQLIAAATTSHAIRQKNAEEEEQLHSNTYLPELDTTADIAKVTLIVADTLVVILCVLIHPHFRQSYAVPFQYVHPRTPLCENAEKVYTLPGTSSEHNPKTPTLYGERFRNMCPTCEHGTISKVPPHIHVLNDSSKFSPPQMSKPESYVPRRSKNSRSIENRPPAIVGDQTGSAEFCVNENRKRMKIEVRIWSEFLYRYRLGVLIGLLKVMWYAPKYPITFQTVV